MVPRKKQFGTYLIFEERIRFEIMFSNFRNEFRDSYRIVAITHE